MPDRDLWHFCQTHQWVLFTDNRNREDEDSLAATIEDSWSQGHLPILTLANKGKFEHSDDYALKVAADVAEALFVAFADKIRHQPRIYVPFS